MAFFCPSLGNAASSPIVVWSRLDDPLGTLGTSLHGVSGVKVVGEFRRTENSTTVHHSFVYDGTSFSTLDNPFDTTTGSQRTNANGIDGSNVVGSYRDSVGTHGFLYDGNNWTTLDDPSATLSTFANAISGNKIVGYYTLRNSSISNRGYVYDMTTGLYTTLTNPGFPSYVTTATGVSGNKIVGFYNSASGGPPGSPSFLYDGITWTGLSDPQATNNQTYAQGIDGNNVVGYYDTPPVIMASYLMG